MKSLLEMTSSNQNTVLDMVAKGLSFTEAAKKIGATKQYIQQTFRLANSLILSGLMDVARANQVEVRSVDSAKGILRGYSPWLKNDVFITFIPRRGVRVWNWFDRPDEVRDKELLEDAKTYLLELADRGGVVLASSEKALHPAKLALRVFAGLTATEETR